MSLFKYLDFEGLQHVLNGNVKFAQPGAFNDPFEMLPVLDMEAIALEREERSLSIDCDILAPRRADDGRVDELPESLYTHDAFSRQIRDQLDRQIGVLCLCRNPSSLLMWAHYADSHTGGLIEFDEGHEYFSQGLHDVYYTKRRPRRPIGWYMNAREPIPVSELCVKSSEWGYEEEVRLIRQLSDCTRHPARRRDFPIYTMSIPPEAIRAITVGKRMPQDRVEQLFRKTQARSLVFKRAEFHGSEFALEYADLRLGSSITLGRNMKPLFKGE